MTEEEKKEAVRKLLIRIPDEIFVDFALKLHHETIPMKKFFNLVIEGYAHDDPTITNFIDKAVAGTRSKIKTKLLQKERELTTDIKKKFGLDEKEIEDIYDIFEDEDLDL